MMSVTTVYIVSRSRLTFLATIRIVTSRYRNSMPRGTTARCLTLLVLALVQVSLAIIGHNLASAQQASPVIDERTQKFETEFRLRNSEKGTYWTLTERMAHHRVPAMSIAVIRDGELAWSKAYGVQQAGSEVAVDTETVFSVGSLSKVATAAATLRLVDQGELDLDANVNNYLKQWQIPVSELTDGNAVSLRRIMSHTAGLTVHGFRDFQPSEKLPTTLDILHGRRPAKNRPLRVQVAPGTEFKYSGGGVMIEQQIIEELLTCDYAAAADQLVFKALQMKRSTFACPLPASHGNIAKAHGRTGQPRALPRGWESMPESAASGLWTTPTDYAKLLIALIESYRGVGMETFLGSDLAKDMMTEVKPSRFGLGPALFGTGPTRCFEHGGSNDSYKAYFRANLASGDGVVICTNGARGKALIREVRQAIAAAEAWPQSESSEDPPGWAPLASKLLDWLQRADEVDP